MNSSLILKRSLFSLNRTIPFRVSSCFRQYSTEEQSENLEKKPELSPLEEKEKELLMVKDAYRRALADMENLRNRTKKEVENASTYSIQKFAVDLLETSDTLDIAVKSTPLDQMESNKPLKDLHEGIILTQHMLTHCFKRFGITSFDPTGEKFDPNLHQALYQAPVPGKEPGTVLETSKIGFMIRDRVLRPASVGVVSESK